MKCLTTILLILTISAYSQSDNSFTTQESDESVNTSNNTTRINLFDIEIDGKKIPINLIYKHTGIKVNDLPNLLGYGWDIENIGIIKQTVNDKTDNIGGWFTNPIIDLTSNFSATGNCDQNIGPHGYDYSPDFFSCNSSTGLHFDFLYKKIYPNPATPILLSNDPGIKIDTNFSNFINNQSIDNNNIVFTIFDNGGYKYKFMNGPILYDQNRDSYPKRRNDYYIKTIENSNKMEVAIFDYARLDKVTEKWYRVGYTNAGYYDGYDSSNNISSSTSADYYFVDNARLCIEKITTSKMIVKFTFTDEKYLDEIIIEDLRNNYIGGYKFIYGFETERSLLSKVKKYNKDKSNSITLFEFKYFFDGSFEPSVIQNQNGHYEDFFGYNNGIYKDFPFPLQRRISATEILPADNFYPNIAYAKLSSLAQIKNIYSGITEFDYQLNYDNNPLHRDILYGGGLLIKSIVRKSTNSKRRLTRYSYTGLRGYVFATDDIDRHYTAFTSYDIKYFSKIPRLVYYGAEPNETFQLDDSHSLGNFFSQVIEKKFNENDEIIEEIIKNYKDNYTGVYKSSLLINEVRYGEHGVFAEETNYIYDYNTLEVIDRAKYNAQVRLIPAIRCAVNRQYDPIPINRVRLINKKVTMFSNTSIPNSIEYNYTYTNANNNLLRSVSESTSDNSNSIKTFYYSTDQELSTTPHRQELISKNIIGIPLLQKKYRDSEKLFEEKTEYDVYSVSQNNLLFPNSTYYKKGGNNLNFEKKVTYTRYDEKGNPIEYVIENGITICLIWGRDQTQVVAKLENINYQDIPPNLIADIHNAVGDMSSELDNLRTSPEILALKPMITTYTYNSLVGISSVTDSKGYTMYYEYDDFNKLKFIKDADGKLLKEYEYNYEPQN